MNKVLISVLGNDQPGILATVATIINQRQGNIENVSQTLLHTVFAAILLVDVPHEESPEKLQQALCEAGASMALNISVYPWDNQTSDWHDHTPETQPYIISAIGPDRQGLVANVANQLYKHGVNISNLQAIFKGGKNPMENVMVFEIDVPRATNMDQLREALAEIASRLDLEISVQHRKIFESVSNILT